MKINIELQKEINCDKKWSTKIIKWSFEMVKSSTRIMKPSLYILVILRDHETMLKFKSQQFLNS